MNDTCCNPATRQLKLTNPKTLDGLFRIMKFVKRRGSSTFGEEQVKDLISPFLKNNIKHPFQPGFNTKRTCCFKIIKDELYLLLVYSYSLSIYTWIQYLIFPKVFTNISENTAKYFKIILGVDPNQCPPPGAPPTPRGPPTTKFDGANGIPLCRYAGQKLSRKDLYDEYQAICTLFEPVVTDIGNIMLI